MKLWQLNNKRASTFTSLVNEKRDGLATIAEVARKLAKPGEKHNSVCHRLYNYVLKPGKRKSAQLMPAEQCIEIAKLFGIQASDLYVELTNKEQKRMSQTPQEKETKAAKKTARTDEAAEETPLPNRLQRLSGFTTDVTVKIDELGISAKLGGKIEIVEGKAVLHFQVPVENTLELVLHMMLPAT